MIGYVTKVAHAGRKVNIIYLSASGVMTKRMIRILSYHDEKVIAYCYMRNKIRTFKRNNILAMELVEQRMEVYA